MNRRHRGRGKLKRGKDSHGRAVYVGDWIEADGVRHRRVLSSDKQVAERMLAKLVRERDLAEGGLVTEEGQERLLAEIKDKYLGDLGASRRPAYVREVRRILEFLARVLGPVRIRDVTPDRMLEWRRARLAGMEKRKGASARTVNLELGVLKACLSWAERMNLVGRNPIARLKPVATNESTERKRRRSLGEDEIGRFLRAADEDDALRASLFAAE